MDSAGRVGAVSSATETPDTRAIPHAFFNPAGYSGEGEVKSNGLPAQEAFPAAKKE
jgi:hypothetical protein